MYARAKHKHTGHMGHTGARGHTDHTDEPHNHPPKPNDTPARPRDGRNRGRLNSRKNSRTRRGIDRAVPAADYSTIVPVHVHFAVNKLQGVMSMFALRAFVYCTR